MEILKVSNKGMCNTIRVADEDILCSVYAAIGESCIDKVVNKEDKDYIIFSEGKGNINIPASLLSEGKQAMSFILGDAIICKLIKSEIYDGAYMPSCFEDMEEIQTVCSLMEVDINGED